MSQLVDIVPNHMAISGRENAWWWDVLENGQSSRYASYFDIDWEPPEERLRLRVLDADPRRPHRPVHRPGRDQLVRDGARSSSATSTTPPPCRPGRSTTCWARWRRRSKSDPLASIATALGRLPPAVRHRPGQRRGAPPGQGGAAGQPGRAVRGASPTVAAAVDAAVAAVNADRDAVDALLERQNYRLAYWKVAGQELDYRRFFDITTLIALRSENLFVFADTHEKMIELVRAGKVDGLRVDHVDGLREPAAYLRLLRQAAGADATSSSRRSSRPTRALPADWAVEGTTGYDFAARVNGLFVDPAGEGPLTDIYADRGRPARPTTSRWSTANKHLVMREVLAADVNRLTNALVCVCERHRRHRDYTRLDCSRAVREVLACLDVYRTYVRPGGSEPSPERRGPGRGGRRPGQEAGGPRSRRTCSPSSATCC